MKRYLVIALVIFSLSAMQAQRHELGLMFGFPNISGDIGKTNYIQLLPLDNVSGEIPYTGAFMYRWNFNPQMGLRLNLSYNHVSFNDNYAKQDYRSRRGFKGTNDIIESSIVFEYNFFEINDEQYFAHSPYIFAGVGAFMYKERLYRFSHLPYYDAQGNPIPPPPSNPDQFVTEVNYDEEYKSAFTLPIGVGYKFKVNYNWVISAEIGVRYTPTDNLDYSKTRSDQYQDERTYVDPVLINAGVGSEIIDRQENFKASQFTGNLVSKDWYVISGVSITYAFGRPPCFCKN